VSNHSVTPSPHGESIGGPYGGSPRHGVPGGAVGPPSVLTSVESVPGDGKKVPWSRQQKRVFHRTIACFNYWEGHGYQSLWVMLTSSPKSPPGTLSRHHKALRRIVERTFGFRGMEHCTVETREGLGVLHIVWSWRGGSPGSFYVPQEWLAEQWEKIHGASYCWITRVRKGGDSGKRISRYMVSQYVAGQDARVRLSWSWKTFRLSIVKTWQGFRAAFRGRLGKAGFAMWRRFLRGEAVPMPDGSTWDLEYLRAHGPPDLFPGYLWARGNDGTPLKPMYPVETTFTIGARSWRTVGPKFAWEPIHA